MMHRLKRTFKRHSLELVRPLNYLCMYSVQCTRYPMNRCAYVQSTWKHTSAHQTPPLDNVNFAARYFVFCVNELTRCLNFNQSFEYVTLTEFPKCYCENKTKKIHEKPIHNRFYRSKKDNILVMEKRIKALRISNGIMSKSFCYFHPFSISS